MKQLFFVILTALSLTQSASALDIKTYFCTGIKSLNTGGGVVNFWCHLDNGTVSQMFMSPTENDVNGPYSIPNSVSGQIQTMNNNLAQMSRTNSYLSMINSFNLLKRTNPTSTQKLRVQTRISNVIATKEIIHSLSIEE